LRGAMHAGEPKPTLVSGGCHLGGIDIWAEEIAGRLGLKKIIHLPRALRWDIGFKPRNLAIVRDSDIVHNIVVAEYPAHFQGMRFPACYHCNTDKHIKSGGCWTAKRAQKLGKLAVWHVIYD
jgi:hypothetical protein